MKTEVIRIEKDKEANVIIGQSHFIKTVEDIYEAIITGCSRAQFGVAFVEASGKCLVRKEGNDAFLTQAAAENAFKIGAGHAFIILLKEAYPIQVLNALKNVQEVCHIFCATANDVEVIIAETALGRGVLGVIDGFQPHGIESDDDIKERRELLRTLQYKR